MPTRPRSSGLHLDGSLALGVGFDLEADGLPANEAIEVQRGGKPVAVEEVFLAVRPDDEAEAALGNDSLDGSGGHDDLQYALLETSYGAGPVREEPTTKRRLPATGRNPAYHVQASGGWSRASAHRARAHRQSLIRGPRTAPSPRSG